MSEQKNTKDMERAQAAFHKKETQAREGKVAMAEYKAAAEAQRANTVRLRELRLAKEAADARAAAEAPVAAPAPAKSPGKNATAKTATAKKRK